MIPRRLVRTVPAMTSATVEHFWADACDLHPDWEHVTLRDPTDPIGFPITSPHWNACTSGAQRAGLIRLEELWHRGGVYIDSDFECYRPFDSLLGVDAFIGWEDASWAPDAVLGACPGHPAIRAALLLAMERLSLGASSSGPKVTTQTMTGRDDVLELPPGSFYPYHYTEKERRHEDHQATNPWAFGAHHWAGSWLT